MVSISQARQVLTSSALHSAPADARNLRENQNHANNGPHKPRDNDTLSIRLGRSADTDHASFQRHDSQAVHSLIDIYQEDLIQIGVARNLLIEAEGLHEDKFKQE